MKKENVSYIGIFTPHIDGSLGKDIPNQHVTLAYAPNDEQFKALLPHLGKNCEVNIIGYGKDLQNEGLLVEIPNNIPYFGAEQKHITLSISQDGKAVNTGYLQFDKEFPDRLDAQLGDRIVGKIAVFSKDRQLIYDKESFDEYNIAQSVDISSLLVARCVSEDKEPMAIEDLLDSKFLVYVNDEGPVSCSLEDLNRLFVEKTKDHDVNIRIDVCDPMNGQSYLVLDNVQDVAFGPGIGVIVTDKNVITNIDEVQQEYHQELESTEINHFENR